jgi:gliding motility-associated-like protein
LNLLPKDAEKGNIVPTNTLYTWKATEIIPLDSISGYSNQTNPENKIYQLLKTKTISGTVKYDVLPISSSLGTCVGDTFKLIVDIHPVPNPIVTISDTGICKGSEISVNTTFDETYFPSTLYSWSTGQKIKSLVITPQQSTIFKLIATSNGCTSLPDSVSVFVDQFVPNTNAGSDVTICRGDSIELNATGGKSYVWEFDKSLSDTLINNPKAAPYVTTTYTVKATNDFCSKSSQVKITIDKCLKELPFKIPQIYTPNADGSNDSWELIDIDYFPKNSITIFNRWGDIVYEKSSYLNEWDGKNASGDDLPDGTYYYVVDLGNGHELYKGFVVITR